MTINTKEQASNFKMKFAWSLEVIFCLTGLLIAFSQSYIGITNSKSGLSTETLLILLVGMLPMVAIALSELIKIPLMTGIVFSRSIFVKLFAGSVLFYVCVLTFESMMIGQEQMYSLRAKPVKEYRLDENRLAEKIALIDEKIVTIGSLSASDIKREAEASLNAQLNPINEQIDDLRKRELSLRSNNDSAEVQELIRQVDLASTNKQNITSTYNLNLQTLNEQLKQLNNNEQTELQNAIFKGGIRSKYSNDRSSIQKQISALNNDFRSDIELINQDIENLNKQIAFLSKPSSQLKDDLALIAAQIIDLQNNKNNIIQSNNKNVLSLLEDSKNKKALIDDLNIEKASFAEELNTIRDKLATSANESFIHKIAAMFYGVDNLADLSEEQVGSFALFHMMTIAFVVSIIGPALTYLAYKNQLQNDNKPRKFPMRALAKSVLKRVRSPKVVTKIKEIEVEKEVIKEVPVEKIRYEEVIKPEPVEIPIFIQVPVPTDPKDLPKIDELKPTQLRPIAAVGGRA